MLRKTAIAVFAIVAGLCFAVPAAAETFTSGDGVLSIELPDENWKQIEDPTKWIALSDGGNIITIEHFSNGEKLPEMSVADNHYVNVYQAVFSTQNEVFIITGSVVDAAKIPEIAQSIITAKVLKYDTKLAVTKEKETASDELSVVPLDETMYVTAEWLNVRSGCSVDDDVIGGYKYGAPVKVTGAVRKNGEYMGWYQVSYENRKGYVSGSFLSESKPDQKEDSESGSDTSSDTTYTGDVKTAFDEYGESYTLYEGTDGYWRDRSGTEYVRLSDTRFQVRDGNKILTTDYYADQEGEGEYQYCWYCDEWYKQGDEFDNHYCPNRDAAEAGGSQDDYDNSDQEGEADYQYCEYCGEWYLAGDEFDYHYCPDRDAAMSGNNEDDYDYSDQEGEGNYQYCWDCGEWYLAGEEFDNHDCPGRD